MKIISVKAENVRARDFDLKLAPVTIIYGSNDVGKTAVIDAVKIALLGYKPGLGKQGVSTMELAGDDKLEMRTLVEFDNGQKSFCNFTRKPDGGTTTESGLLEGEVEILDMDEFFRRPAADQLTYFMQHVNTDNLGFDESSLLDRLKQLEALPAAEGLKGRDEMLKLVDTTIARRDGEGISLQNWLAMLQDRLKAELKDLNAKKKNSAGASITFRGAGNKPKSQKDLIASKRKELDGITTQLAELLAQKKQYDSVGDRRAKLEETIAGITIMSDKESLKEIATLTKETDAYKSGTVELEVALLNLRNQAKALQDKANALKGELDGCTKRLSSVVDTCTACGQKIPEKTVAAQHEMLEHECGLIRKEITSTGALLAKVIEEGQATKAKLEASKEKDQKNERLLHRIEACNDILAGIKKDRDKVDKAKAELAGLNAVKAPDESTLDDLTKKQAIVSTTITELTTDELKFDQWTADEKKRKDLEKEGLALHARIEIYKGASAIVTEEQEKLIAHAFDSILEPARRITDGILPGVLGFRNGTIGIATNDNWITYKTFSGNWKTIAFAALAVALARQSAVKLVCLDELGTIEPERKMALIDRLLELAEEGFIDNAIGCDIRDKADYIKVNDPKFTFIEL